MPRNHHQHIQTGCAQLSLEVTDAFIDQCMAYLQAVKQWNRSFNLTAITQMDEMVTKHLLDSLSIASFLDEEMYVDVGCGAGFPSIPLAMLYSDKKFILVEPNQKKCNFLDIVRIKFGLNNIQVKPSRVQDLALENLADGVLSRAFTQSSELYQLCHSLVKPGGKIFAMKGEVNQQELEGVPEHVSVEVNPIVVPFLDAKRHLVVIREPVREKSNSSQ